MFLKGSSINYKSRLIKQVKKLTRLESTTPTKRMLDEMHLYFSIGVVEEDERTLIAQVFIIRSNADVLKR